MVITLLKTSEESVTLLKLQINNSNSLRKRLLWVLLLLIISAWIVTIIVSYLQIRKEVEVLLDTQLTQIGNSLLEIQSKTPQSEPHSISENISSYHKLHNKKIFFQAWRNNHMLLSSNNAPRTKLTETAGYANVNIHQTKWRIFTIQNQDTLIEVGENMEIRNKLIQSVVLDMLLPMLIMLPVIASAIWIGIGTGITPLRKLTHAISKCSHNQLSPIDLTNAPQEIIPLAQELNNLLSRLNDAFIRERHFTANASHELRTPLTIIKTQAQVALRSRTPKEKKENLNKIIQGIDRATHMVNQLLTLTRIEPNTASTLYTPLNLYNVISFCIAEYTALASKKEITITLDGDKNASIKAYKDGLILAVNNLLDNAIRYTPPKGTITINIAQTDNHIILTIQDSGPGIEPQNKEKVFDQFYRIPGTNEEGCGIGLAIVKRVLDLHKAHIHLHSSQNPSGLTIDISFNKNM